MIWLLSNSRRCKCYYLYFNSSLYCLNENLIKQLLHEKNDFFPLNRALSLSAMDEDSTESKVDELLRQIHHLVERQKEEVT